MSKYYEVIRRGAVERDGPGPAPDHRRPGSTVAIAGIASATSLLPTPAEHEMAAAVARAPGIQLLGERLAPLAVLDSRVRLLVSGCRSGDGASTIAAALAMDLSQRLSLRTMLVDAHLRHPSLHRSFPRTGRASAELVLSDHLQIRPTGWPRLDLLTCWQATGDKDCRVVLDEFESLAVEYPAVVVDLGVARLDARMLGFARPTDPIVLIVRYGQTERQELATTVGALRAAKRAIAGVILNAVAPGTKSAGRLVNP
jgi:protein-tyrosine kinase